MNKDLRFYCESCKSEITKGKFVVRTTIKDIVYGTCASCKQEQHKRNERFLQDQIILENMNLMLDNN